MRSYNTTDTTYLQFPCSLHSNALLLTRYSLFRFLLFTIIFYNLCHGVNTALQEANIGSSRRYPIMRTQLAPNISSSVQSSKLSSPSLASLAISNDERCSTNSRNDGKTVLICGSKASEQEEGNVGRT